MMFDPASLGAALQPGDKMSLTFHKGQPKTMGGSFMDNATKAGAVPGAPGAGGPPPMMAPPPDMGAPPPMMDPGAGGDPQGAMIAALRARMGGAQ